MTRKEVVAANQRDLGIFLFGACMDKGRREEILGAIEPEMVDLEIGRLFASLKANSNADIRTWFDNHSAPIENGHSLIQAAIAAIEQHCAKRRLKAVISQLQCSEAGLDAKSLALKLRDIATEIEDTL
tara:strand:- start:274 stop:657 length:384 start_codon:yes stop_codon:yes gene_type:complete